MIRSHYLRRFAIFVGIGGTLPEPDVYSPSLDFSDERNSQYCSLWG